MKLAAALPERVQRFAVPIIVGWVAVAGLLNVFVPQLERVVAEHSPAFLQADSRATTAVTRMAEAFGEGGTNNSAYLLLTGDEPLGAAAHDYYARLVAALRADPAVTGVIDLWSDPVAGAANESADHRAAYVQLWLQGAMGETRAAESLDTVRRIVADSHPPAGLHTYVTGPSAVIVDEFRAADLDTLVISGIGFVVILLMLLAVYRSPVTAALPLVAVGLSLLVARPVIGLLGMHGLVQASMFASALSTALILGAGTDYAIFFLGRYHEARRAGDDRDSAYRSAYRGVNHIVVASALTIAGACTCLEFAQISVLKTAGLPSAVGMLVALAAALTLTPALVVVAGRRGHLDPVRGTGREARWRRIGAAVVRWPIPTFVAAAAVLVILGAGLPTLRLSFDEVGVQPADSAGVQGMAELARHFPDNQLSPDFVTITADHDLRNPSDAVAIEEVSRALVKLPDVGSVQSITRPTGRLLAESLLVNQAATLGTRLEQNTGLLRGQLADLHRVDDSLAALLRAIDGAQADADDADRTLTGVGGGVRQAGERVRAVQAGARDIAAAMDSLHTVLPTGADCDADPACTAARAAMTAYDRSTLPGAVQGLDAATATAGGFLDSAGRITASVHSALGRLKAARAEIVLIQSTTHRLVGTLDALSPQLDLAADYLREVARNYGAPESGAFYLPQQVFDDPRFAVALRTLFSPDGRTTRILVFGNTASFGQSGIDRAREIERVGADAVRGTRLKGAVVQVGGIGATFSDIDRIIRRDFRILAIVTMLFVFSVVLVTLRSLVAAITVVATVAVSFGTAMGLSVLVWQHLFDRPLHWVVPPLAFIALVAVGSDYNLLFTARFREEAPGGLRTGMIRAFAGTGSVVTVAGLVFATTMFAMLGSRLTNIMQLGSTIGMGLLVDTFIVRAVVVPAIATHLRMWFWWPLPRREIMAAGGAAAR